MPDQRYNPSNESVVVDASLSVALKQPDTLAISDSYPPPPQPRLPTLTFPRKSRWRLACVFQRNLDVILGLALILAGLFKGRQLLTNLLFGSVAAFPRWFLIGASAFELAFGCWLLAGLFRGVTRWLSLALFTTFAAAALSQAVHGATSCACFGDLRVNPWLMFAFDLLAVIALSLWTPSVIAPRFALLSTVCTLFLLAAGYFAWTDLPRVKPAYFTIDLGRIVQGGQKQQTICCSNDTGTFVEVAAIKISCPCTNIYLDRNEVAVGQFLTGKVVMDLQLKPEFVGDLAIEATVWTRRGTMAFVLVFQAQVVRSNNGLG